MNMSSILLNQCQGEQQRPYSVFLKEPVLVFVGARIVNGWSNDRNFVRRKVAVTEDVFDVTLFERTAMIDSKTDEKTEQIWAQNRCKPFGFGPNLILVVAQDNNARVSV